MSGSSSATPQERISLTVTTVGHVVDKFLVELESQLDAKKVTMEVDAAARLWLAEHGYDPIMGARPMARLIQDKIKKSLAEDILFGRLANGGHVVITIKNDDIAVEFEEETEQAT